MRGILMPGIRSMPRRAVILLLVASAPRQSHACCKAQFIEKFNLKTTAFAINGTGISVDNARRAHILTAMSFVPKSLYGDPNALRLEFGVRNGHMINFMASRPVPLEVSVGIAAGSVVDDTVRNPSGYTVPPSAASLSWDGFDSFQGLPKSTLNAARLGWGAHKYSVKGQLPTVPPHVHLHVGWFNDTLPPFLESTRGAGPVAFAHLDADIYTSTITVLDALAARCRLRVGSVLAFDEIFGPPRIHEEELRALQEATAKYGLSWRFITYLNHMRSNFGRAAIQIVKPPLCASPQYKAVLL